MSSSSVFFFHWYLKRTNNNNITNSYTNTGAVVYQYKKLLHYDKIDVLEGIDIKKSNKLKECMICHYWFLKDIGYKINQKQVMNAMIYQ